MANDKLWEEVRESEERSATQLSMLLEKVQDLPSFVRFIDALSKDRKDADRKEATTPAGLDTGWNGWKNGSLSTFLESAVAWFEDNGRGDPAFLARDNPWKAAARVIYAGKYYE
ncbi:MAG: hypothetical protein EOR30_21640 [Mesorhizobium sp.]|uniref:DUF7660 family protein n=1 Tax=unclassified Mesorhizobium TaxID=325217 RepID=UPI000FCBF91E|nr:MULTISPECIES: hypothetical protein [unclassified Mesorhizobium]RUV75313.1 hypothetical protein EOA78_06335 [Mesorhizobium sp. M5C.F.Cr.IN.023.01.1.1]RWF88999.1 MAG: hypothetical protein EOQ36_06310 [Mesorhizobium sp.]RWF95574.1 MAG: hypothetical protein EOQ45_07680 [Mesorhizobium sp.]RWI40178.1 MAG: hypothetical protein EOR14_16275 [Mesorhizobium sp.]RWI45856.1 MAG: hypothetical protein EOR15_20310 [Mesorhizobium sp.]